MKQPGGSFISSTSATMADANPKESLLLVVKEEIKNEQQESDNWNDGQKKDVQFKLE